MTEERRAELQELLESDLAVRRECLGLQTQMAPFPQHCSTQRLVMFSSHSAQAMVLNHPEPPRIFTGMENVIGKYSFSTTRRDQDIHVLGIVPKFRPTSWRGEMPMYTVIYRGATDGKIGYIDVSRYTYLHDGFGYMNVTPDINTFACESDIPKEMVITKSPAWVEEDYCMGLNANVIYLTDPAATEDAFVISESLAERWTNLAISKVRLSLSQDDILLNLYGDHDADEYKVIPDIGDVVRADGILAAIRTKNATSYVSDMTLDALQRVEPLHDELHKAPPGSKILDVDVYVDFKTLARLKESHTVFDQLLKIYDDHQYYYNEIVRYYTKFKEQGVEISDEFNTLVLRCIEMSNNRKFVRKNLRLCDPHDPIEFMTIVITYAHERKISLGSKLTGRDGGKGVVSEIRPDDAMPTDQDGFRADIIMTSPSIVNRMNPSQLYEQFWNRTSDQVVRNAKAANMPLEQAYQYFIEFCKDFRVNYGRALDEYILDTPEKKLEWAQDVLDTGYIRLLAGWTKPRLDKNGKFDYSYLDKIARKYGVEPTPVTFKVLDEETGVYKPYTTKTPALIGSKYLMYLDKVPDEKITTTSGAHVNQFEIPIKPKSKRVKEQSLVGVTPQRFGEDEVCMLNMSLGANTVARMMCIHAAAPSVAQNMFEKLLTELKPSQMASLDIKTQDIINQNRNVMIFADMMGVLGYDVRTTNVDAATAAAGEN